MDNIAIGWLYCPMSSHSVAEARNNLSDLIARAERGEEVVITRHGKPIVELRPVPATGPKPRPMTQADWDWLDSVRVTLAPGAPSAVELVRQMRDDGY
jgi:prevent-host-death family protein